MSTPYQKFTKLVHEINKKSPVIDAAVLVNSDGLILASAVQKQISDERVGALGAQFGAQCEQFSQGIGHGEFEINLLSSATGYVVISNLKNKIYFVAKANQKTDIALVLAGSLKVVKELRKIESDFLI